MGTTRQAGRQPNTLLQQARANQQSPSGSGRRMSRQELAEQVNGYLHRAHGRTGAIDANYIGKLERGEHHWPNHDTREALRTVLGAPTDSALGFYIVRGMVHSTTAPDRSAARVRAHRTSTSIRDGHGTAIEAVTSREPAQVPWSAVHAHGEHWSERSLVEEVAMATEESGRFVRRGSGSVDQWVLDQLNADVARLAIEYLARPPYFVFRPLAQLRREVFDLLDQRQRPAVLPSLYRVAGQLCALLAHASADLAQTPAADTHARTAWLCAEMAEDDALRGYVRWIQSNVAYWDGDYRRVAELAHSGQQYPAAGSSLLRLASQEARAWAACGESAEVDRALTVALTERDRSPTDEMPGVFTFEPAKAAYYASETRIALGGSDNIRLAITEAREAIQLLTAQPEAERCPEFLAAAWLDLANAYLTLDELDAAEEHLGTVLALPAESRTQPIIGRMTTANTTLGQPRYADVGQSRDLRERISVFLAYPAAHEPPSVSA